MITSNTISVTHQRFIEESAAIGRRLIAGQVINWTDSESRREQLFKDDHPSSTLFQQSVSTMNRVSLETRNYGVQLTQAIKALTTRQTHWAPECPICMDEVFLGEASITRCGHIFHTECLQRSFQLDQSRCSLCRVSLTRAECFKVHNGLPERPPPGISSATDRESRAVLAGHINSDSDEIRSSTDKAISIIKEADAFLRESNNTLKSCEELNKYTTLVMDLRQSMITDYAHAVHNLEHKWKSNVLNNRRISKDVDTFLAKMDATIQGLEEDRHCVQLEQEKIAAIASQLATEKRKVEAERELFEQSRINIDRMKDEMSSRMSHLSQKEARLNALYEVTRNRIKENNLDDDHEPLLDNLSNNHMQNHVRNQEYLRTNPNEETFALNLGNDDLPNADSLVENRQQSRYKSNIERMIPPNRPYLASFLKESAERAAKEQASMNISGAAGPSNARKRTASAAIGDTNIRTRQRLGQSSFDDDDVLAAHRNSRNDEITPNFAIEAPIRPLRTHYGPRFIPEARNTNRGFATFRPNPRQVQRPSAGVARRSSHRQQISGASNEVSQHSREEGDKRTLRSLALNSGGE